MIEKLDEQIWKTLSQWADAVLDPNYDLQHTETQHRVRRLTEELNSHVSKKDKLEGKNWKFVLTAPGIESFFREQALYRKKNNMNISDEMRDKYIKIVKQGLHRVVKWNNDRKVMEYVYDEEESDYVILYFFTEDDGKLVLHNNNGNPAIIVFEKDNPEKIVRMEFWQVGAPPKNKDFISDRHTYSDTWEKDQDNDIVYFVPQEYGEDIYDSRARKQKPKPEVVDQKGMSQKISEGMSKAVEQLGSKLVSMFGF